MIPVTITLPIPAREISPNAQRGQSKWAAIKKSKLVKLHRMTAMLEIQNRMMAHPSDLFQALPLGYSLAHFFPTARFRDEDNADGACKAYRDGICDALGIDDKDFCKITLSTRQKDKDSPRVEITVYFQD